MEGNKKSPQEMGKNNKHPTLSYLEKLEMSMPWWAEGIILMACLFSGIIFLYIVAG